MEKHKEEGEFVSANQIHCALGAYPDCPFQCHSNEDLLKHIESAHKKRKCKDCSETFETNDGLDKHRRKSHPTSESTSRSQPEESREDQSELKCNICGLIEDTTAEMEDHMKYHEDNDEYDSDFNPKSHKPCREFAKNDCQYGIE